MPPPVFPPQLLILNAQTCYSVLGETGDPPPARPPARPNICYNGLEREEEGKGEGWSPCGCVALFLSYRQCLTWNRGPNLIEPPFFRWQRGTNMMPKKVKKKSKGKKKKGAAAAPAPVPAPAPAPAPAPIPATFYSSASAPSASSEMDHSVIKKWVLEVAARRTVATSDQIKRYFHGRVEEGR